MLRAGMMPKASTSTSTSPSSSSNGERDKENEELRERIRTLERGWDAIVQALASQGLPGLVPSMPTNTDSTPKSESTVSSTTTLTSTTLPLSPASTHSSLDLDMVYPSSTEYDPLADIVSAEPPATDSTSSLLSDMNDNSPSTRHLARVAIISGRRPLMSLQRVDSTLRLRTRTHPSSTSVLALPRPALSTPSPLPLAPLFKRPLSHPRPVPLQSLHQPRPSTKPRSRVSSRRSSHPILGTCLKRPVYHLWVTKCPQRQLIRRN